MRADPYQLENLITRAPESVVAALARRLEAVRSCAGAQCP
jgi:hypothetical protein